MTARPLSPEVRDLEAVERLLLDGLACVALARRGAAGVTPLLPDRRYRAALAEVEAAVRQAREGLAKVERAIRVVREESAA